MTAASPVSGKDLAALLASEIEALRACVKILGDETQALQEGDVDQLQLLTARKNELVAALNQHTEARVSRIAAGALRSQTDLLQSWLSQANAVDAALVQPLATELRTLAEQAKASNDLNGKLINLRLSHNQQALMALHASTDRPSVYDQAGHAQVGSGGRTFGKA